MKVPLLNFLQGFGNISVVETRTNWKTAKTKNWKTAFAGDMLAAQILHRDWFFSLSASSLHHIFELYRYSAPPKKKLPKSRGQNLQKKILYVALFLIETYRFGRGGATIYLTNKQKYKNIYIYIIKSDTWVLAVSMNPRCSLIIDSPTTKTVQCLITVTPYNLHRKYPSDSAAGSGILRISPLCSLFTHSHPLTAL